MCLHRSAVDDMAVCFAGTISTCLRGDSNTFLERFIPNITLSFPVRNVIIRMMLNFNYVYSFVKHCLDISLIMCFTMWFILQELCFCTGTSHCNRKLDCVIWSVSAHQHHGPKRFRINLWTYMQRKFRKRYSISFRRRSRELCGGSA